MEFMKDCQQEEKAGTFTKLPNPFQHSNASSIVLFLLYYVNLTVVFKLLLKLYVSMCHTFLMSINVGMSGLFKQCVQQYITKTSVLAVNINHDPYLLKSINFVNYCTST